MNKTASDSIKEVFSKFKNLGISIATLSNGITTMDAIGEVSISRDGNQDVITINPKTHVHLNWDNLLKITISEEDVGAGLEPTATIMDISGQEMLKIYFLKSSKKDILETFGNVEIYLKL
jgi:hypothetical protein